MILISQHWSLSGRVCLSPVLMSCSAAVWIMTLDDSDSLRHVCTKVATMLFHHLRHLTGFVRCAPSDASPLAPIWACMCPSWPSCSNPPCRSIGSCYTISHFIFQALQGIVLYPHQFALFAAKGGRGREHRSSSSGYRYSSIGGYRSYSIANRGLLGHWACAC